jgi:hypothetical protein
MARRRLACRHEEATTGYYLHRQVEPLTTRASPGAWVPVLQPLRRIGDKTIAEHASGENTPSGLLDRVDTVQEKTHFCAGNVQRAAGPSPQHDHWVLIGFEDEPIVRRERDRVIVLDNAEATDCVSAEKFQALNATEIDNRNGSIGHSRGSRMSAGGTMASLSG